MESQVKKMYENAGIEKSKCWDDCNTCTRTSYDKNISYVKADYPPFTAEKQLELIKLLQRKNGYKFSFSSTNDNSEYLFFAHKDNTPVYELIAAGDKCYEEALAGFINTLWQDLTDADKVQIKEILE